MARESRAVMTAREFREQLIRQEDAALREMSRQWVWMENKLTDQYKLLYNEIQDMKARGETVPRQMIYNLRRYQQMMAEIAKELPEYDAQAVQIITKHQVESYTLGLEAAEAVIMDTRPSDPMWNRVGKDAAQITAGFAGNGAPLGQLLQRDYGDLGVKITDALVEGVALGKGAFATAKDMRDAMGMEYNRSVRIARTEINRAYRIANADQYAKSGVVTKVLRLCAKQANTCLACLMMDGDEVPNGVLDDHPNGRCATIAVTVGGIYPQWEHGDVWFEQQDEETQRAIMGPGRYELWKKDGIDPHQMVRMTPNDVWGGSPTVISERELRERYNLTGGNRMLFDVKPAPKPEPKPSVVSVTSKEEAKDALSKMFVSVEDSFMKNNEELIVSNTNQLLKLNERFGALTGENKGYITASRSGRAIGWAATAYRNDWEDSDLSLVSTYFKKPDVLKKEFIKSLESFFNMPSSESDWNIYTVTHEYGHILENAISRKREDWNVLEEKVSKLGFDHRKIQKVRKDAEKKQAKIIYEEIIDIAKKNNPDFKLSENLSRYGHTNHFEAFAEMFANSQLGAPNELGRAMQEWLRKEGF